MGERYDEHLVRTGKQPCRHEGEEDVNEWIEKLATGIVSYFKSGYIINGNPPIENVVDISIRQTLIPHLKEIEKLKKEKQIACEMLDAIQTGDPAHHYDEFDENSEGCRIRALLKKIGLFPQINLRDNRYYNVER